MSKVNTSKEKNLTFYSFSSIKAKTQARHGICVSLYGADTVTANHRKFRFRRFRSCNFDVKESSQSGRTFNENIDEIMETAESQQNQYKSGSVMIVLSTIGLFKERNRIEAASLAQWEKNYATRERKGHGT